MLRKLQLGSCQPLLGVNGKQKHWKIRDNLFRTAEVQGQNLSAINQVWREHTKFYAPSILSFRKLIWSLCKMRALTEANEALQEMIFVVSKGKNSLHSPQDGPYRASKVDIPVPTKMFRENVTEALIQKYSNGCLPVSVGSGIVRKNVLPVPLSYMNGVSVKNREWDILNRSKNDKLGFGNQLLIDSINDTKSESQFLNDTRKLDVQEGKDPTIILHEGAVESCTRINELPADGQILFDKHCLFPWKNRNGHSFSAQCWSEGKIEEIASKDGEDNLLNLRQIASLSVLKVLRWAFNDVIHVTALTRNYELAEHLFLQMHTLGLEPSLQTYNLFLKAVVLERGVIHGMRVVKAMENKNLKPNNFTYATLAIGYSKSLELDLAEAMLDQMVNKQPQYIHPFNSLLAACRLADEPERGVRVLARMRLAEVKPTIRTYELLFSLFGNVNPPYEQGNQQSQEDVSKRISAIEMDMMRNGVEHSQTSMTNLMKAFGAEGMVKELLQYLHVAEDRFNGRDARHLETNLYNIVLHALVEANEWDVAIEIFEKMQSFGVKPNVATYNIMVDSCSLARDLQSARKLMATMLQDGFQPQACTYTVLMKIMLANEDFEAAVNVFNEMKGQDIHPDVVCFNTILRSASMKGRLDIVEFIVEHMHREKIQPDPETCLHVFSAYDACGFLDTALEALQVLSVRMISEDETVQREMKSTFQELVLDEDPNVEEKFVGIFKDSREDLAAALFNMRLCAFCGVPNSWVPDESPWAIRLHLQYNQKPLSKAGV
eukprot:Gb_37339 [translate_table: standard]